MKTIQALLHTFDKNPNPAIIIPQKTPVTLTYATLYTQVQHLQDALASLVPLHIGSRLSIILPTSFEFVAVFLAISCLRAVVVPLNPALRRGEYAACIDELGLDAVIVPKGAASERHAAVLAALDNGVEIIECGFSEGRVVLDGSYKGYERQEGRTVPGPPIEEDTALILQTSGTTGRAKAVPLRHRNLLASTKNVCDTYALVPTDRTILTLPLFHIHGLVASTLAPLYSGGTVILPTRLLPSFWTDFATHHGTWFTCTPTALALILQFARPATTSAGLRFIRSGSAPLSPVLCEKLENAFGVPVLDNYAMTEACGQIASNAPPLAARKARTLGRATGVEVVILDASGRRLPLDTEGEICIRGPSVMSGYLDDEAANAAAFTADGFFRTGDFGRCDGDGFLLLGGRVKEVINKGGEKIGPAELDDAVGGHPAVKEAAAFGIPDEMYGEDVGVAVILRQGGDVDVIGLRRWMRDRVAGFKAPKKVFFVAEMPKTATGKVRRDVLAKMCLGRQAVVPKL